MEPTDFGRAENNQTTKKPTDQSPTGKNKQAGHGPTAIKNQQGSEHPPPGAEGEPIRGNYRAVRTIRSSGAKVRRGHFIGGNGILGNDRGKNLRTGQESVGIPQTPQNWQGHHDDHGNGGEATTQE